MPVALIFVKHNSISVGRRGVRQAVKKKNDGKWAAN